MRFQDETSAILIAKDIISSATSASASKLPHLNNLSPS